MKKKLYIAIFIYIFNLSFVSFAADVEEKNNFCADEISDYNLFELAEAYYNEGYSNKNERRTRIRNYKKVASLLEIILENPDLSESLKFKVEALLAKVYFFTDIADEASQKLLEKLILIPTSREEFYNNQQHCKYILARIYYYKKDFSKARDLFESIKTSVLEDVPAARIDLLLGLIYYLGANGVVKNWSKSRILLENFLQKYNALSEENKSEFNKPDLYDAIELLKEISEKKQDKKEKLD